MKRTTMVVAVWAAMTTGVWAQKGGSEQDLAKEAKNLFEAGDYLKAYPLYSQLVSLYPQNPDYNFGFGACSIYGDADKTKAIRYLTIAVKRGEKDVMALYFLGKAYHLNYQFREAGKNYEEFAAKADPKLIEKYHVKREIETCNYGSNLLSNIKDVVVINKTESDRNNFFRYMNLDGIGGKILTVPEELQSKLDKKSGQPGVIHYPGKANTIYFSSFGKDGTTGKDIYKSEMLGNGKFSTPEKLRGDVNTAFDEDFAFMHSNGRTLYFSSKGHNSMGGYDIFRSDLDPATGTFGPAINLDFAINTPDDDIFYIADSLNKHAYFASGRTSDMAHYHVYNVRVEGIPLQVVYMKGLYASQIDPEQKVARIQVKDLNSGRLVMECTSSNNNGTYVAYVNKPGTYQYLVKTENSPTIHEAIVTIPTYSKPVAIKQEMTLIKENGQEKLIVNTYTDQPLEGEDLSALAAEMLRAKAGLDVNAQENPETPAKEESTTPQLSVEKTMENAPLAAGFPEGTTIAGVVNQMQDDVAAIRTYVTNSEKQSNAAHAYAARKFKESQELVAKAEEKRMMAGDYKSPEQIRSLKESIELMKESAQAQSEAVSAFQAAQSIVQYRESENLRANELQANIDSVNHSETAGNFDAVYSMLIKEKERNILMKEARDTPYELLLNKSKAASSQKRAAEERLTKQRETEQQLKEELSVAQNRLANAKKKEKANWQAKIDQLNTQLTENAVAIAKQTKKIEEAGKQEEQMFTAASMYKDLGEDPSMGFEENEITAVSQTQSGELDNSLRELQKRISALEITDPQTLALVTEELPSAEVAQNSSTTESDKPTESTVAQESLAANAVEKPIESAKDGANSTPVNSGNENAELNSISVQNENTNVQANNTTDKVGTQNNESADAAGTAIKTESNATPSAASLDTSSPETLQQSSATLLNGVPAEKSSVKRMIADAAVAEADLEIMRLKSKDPSMLTDEDKSSLAAWTGLKNEMAKLVPPTSPAQPVTVEEIRSVSQSVMPDYNNDILAINNAPGSELDHTAKRMEYKRKVIARLEEARRENATAAIASGDMKKMEELGAIDQQYSTVIAALKAETNDTENYIASYEAANKTIIESDVDFQGKLTQQIELTEGYLKHLYDLENQIQLLPPATASEKELQDARLRKIENEKTFAAQKIASYKSDLTLIASASQPETNIAAINNTGRNSESATETTAIVNPLGNTESSTATVSESVTENNANATVPKTETLVETESGDNASTNKVDAIEGGTSAVTTEKKVVVSESGSNSTQVSSIEIKTQGNAEMLTPVAVTAEDKENGALENKTQGETEILMPVQVKATATQKADPENNSAAVSIDASSGSSSETLAAGVDNQSANLEAMASAPQTALQKRMQETWNLTMEEVAAMTPEQINEVANFKVREDMEKVKELFTPAPLAQSIFAYENGTLDALESQYASQETALKNKEKIKAVQEEIFLVEAEIEIEENPKHQKRLDREAEEMYAKRAILEIPNSVAIAKWTSEEYQNQMDRTTKAMKENADKIATRIMIRDEVEKKMREAKDAMDDAESLRKKAGPVEDPIEKNDMLRRAYAKETYSINMLKQIQDINKNMDKLLSYSDEELTNMRFGSPETVTAMVEKMSGTFKSDLAAMKSEANGNGAAVSNTNATAEEALAIESKTATASNNNKKTELSARDKAEWDAITADLGGKTFNAAEAGYYSYDDASEYFYKSPNVLFKNLWVRTKRGVYDEAHPINVDGKMPEGVYYKVQVGAFRNKIPQNLYSQFAPVNGETTTNGLTRYTAGYFLTFDKADDIKAEIRKIGYSDAFVVAYKDGKRIPMMDAIAITDPDKAKAMAANQSISTTQPIANTANTASEAPTRNTSYMTNAKDAAPSVMVETINELFFTAQVGVYRRAVRLGELYNLPELNTELMKNKTLRYTSGRFKSVQEAVARRNEARNKGVKDSFVIAYYNGARITLAEAEKLLQEKGNSILIK